MTLQRTLFLTLVFVVALPGLAMAAEEHGALVEYIHWFFMVLVALIALREFFFRTRLQEEIRQLERRVEAHSAELQLSLNQQQVEIAERRKAQLEAEENKQMLQTIIDQAPIFIYLKDLQGRYHLVNRNFVQTMNRGDLIGKTCFDLFDEETAQLQTSHDQMTLQRGEAVYFEEEFHFADKIRQYQSYRFVITDEDGKATGLGGIIIDQTERQKTQAEIQVLSQAVEQSPVAVVITDIQGRVEYVNPSYTLLTGFTKEDILGEKPHYFKSANLNPDEFQGLWADLQRGVEWRGELLYCKVNGDLIWERTTITPIFNAKGRISRFLSVHLDITERKAQLEELQNAKAEAEAASLAKGQFLANMSHEIRTPMNGVIGMANLLMESPLNESQRENVMTIHNCGNELLAVINQILDFSKVEAGKMEVEHHPFDLRGTIEDVMDLLSTRAAEKHLRLFSCLKPGVPELIHSDSTKIRQILVNLVGNAVKFTEEGFVYIKASMQEKFGNHGLLQLEVIDSGVGIPEDKLDKLFNEFSQVDSSITRQYGGTGLGLAISLRLAELLGGDIEVESKLNEGSCFRFSLPVQFDAKREEGLRLKTLEELKDKRVLVVDGLSPGARSLGTMFEGWGAKTDYAGTPTEAIEKLQISGKCDLMVMDYFLSGMEGPQFVANLRSLPQGRKLPVVLLSPRGRTMPDQVVKDPLAEVAHRPIKRARLLQSVKKAMQEQSGPPLDGERGSMQLAGEFPFKILVGEANPINQQLTLRLLEKMGYRADVSGSGKEVLAALESKDYDLILLDLNFGDLGGLEVAHRIHKRYEGGKSPLILAMISNSGSETPQDCMEAGIEDSLIKPIMIQTLHDKLILWGQRRFHAKS